MAIQLVVILLNFDAVSYNVISNNTVSSTVMSTVKSTVKRFCRQNMVKSTVRSMVRSILPTKSMGSTLDHTPDCTFHPPNIHSVSRHCNTSYKISDCAPDHTFHPPNSDSVSKSLDRTHYHTHDSTTDCIVANYITRNCIKIPQKLLPAVLPF